MDNIYLLASKDDYLLRKRVFEILELLMATEEMLQIYDLDEGSVDELLGDLTTISVFDDYRIFWVKNTSALTKKSLLDDVSLEKLKKYIFSPSDSSVLIFTTNDYYPQSVLAKELNKYARVEDVDTIYSSKEDFAKAYIAKENMKIQPTALSAFLANIDDYNTLANELDKLKYYAMGEEIDSAIIERVTCKNIDSKIYEITNAILAKNKGQALKLFYELLEANEEPSRIFNNILGKMLEIMYVKKMIDKKISKEDLAERFNVSSGRAYYMMKNANDISSVTLDRYINELAELNYQARSGNIDEKTGIELFILKA